MPGVRALPARDQEQLKAELDRAIVDEWADLDNEIARLDAEHHFSAKIKRREALRALILGRHSDLAGHLEALEQGSRWDVAITARDNQRIVTLEGKRKLYRLWKLGAFLERCSIQLKQLPDPQDEKGLYTVKEHTGPRHLKALPRLQQAA